MTKYNKMTVKDLTALATERNLTVAKKAKKADIIALLEANDRIEAAIETSEAPTPETKAPKLTVADTVLLRLEEADIFDAYTYTINGKGHILLHDPKYKETIARIRGTKKGAYVFPGRTLKKLWEEAGFEMEFHKGWANEYCIFCTTPAELKRVLVD